MIVLALAPVSLALAAGDPVAGKEKSATCAACHGFDGNGAGDQFPKIAGQVPGYFAETMREYQSGARVNEMMAGMVHALTEQDIEDLAAYYAQLPPTSGVVPEEQLASAERGRELYRIGSSQYSVPACMACHGPAGKGLPARYPRVSGQFVPVLVQALNDYKSGARHSDEMNPIAFRLSSEQIQDLATYMHALN